MFSSSQNDERVTARVSASVKETLQEAANLSGATLNQFLVQSALKEAQKILEVERAIALSQQDADKIFQLMENPPAVNQNLQAAIAKRCPQSGIAQHKDFFGEKR